EDKLRLLRGVRFAATFDFQLESSTRMAIEALAADITQVSAERIAAEMRMMLLDTHRARAIELLREVGLLAAVLPELRPDANPAAWSATLQVLQTLADPSFSLVLAALVHALVDEDQATIAFRRWKLSNHEIETALWLLKYRDAVAEADSIPWPR